MSWLSDIFNPSRRANEGIQSGINELRDAGRQAAGAFAPAASVGDMALGRIGMLNVGTPDEQRAAFAAFRADPGYQFALSEGLRGVRQTQAGRGMLGSGETLKALTEYGQGLADQQFGNWYDRTAGLASMGQNAIGNTVNANLGVATNIAQGLSQMGENRANDSINWSGLLTSGLSKLFR